MTEYAMSVTSCSQRFGSLLLAAGLLLLSGCGGGSAGGGSATVSYPRFGFSVNRGDNTLTAYLVNAGSGQWLHAGYVQTGDTPVAAAVTPDEKFVYVVNQADQTIGGYQLAAGTGRLTAVGAVSTGAGPGSVAVSRNSGYVYVTNATDGTLSGYTVGNPTGALSGLSGSPFTLGGGSNPVAVLANPVKDYLYIANQGVDTVSVYSINSSTGDLAAVAGSPFTTGAGSGPRSLSIDPQGRFLYVANGTEGSVAVFAIDATTGVLTRVDQDAVAVGTQNKTAGNGPNGVTVSVGGKYLYVSNATDATLSIFTVDTTTGLLSPNGVPVPTVANPRSLRSDPSGNFLFVADETARTIRTYRINTSNGTLTSQTTVRARPQPVALEISSAQGRLVPRTDHLYAVNAFSNELRVYSASDTTGALTAQGSGATGNNPVSVAVDPFARFTYVVNNTDDSLSGHTINSSTGALTRIDLAPSDGGTNDLALGIDPQQAVVDPSGRFVYVTATTAGANGEVRAYTINATNGRLTAIGGSPFATGAAPKQLTVDPTGQYLYVVNNNNGGTGNVSAFAIDPVNGALTSLGSAVSAGASPTTVVIDPSARFAYVGNGGTNTLTRFNLALDGTLSSPGMATTQTGPQALAIDPLARFLFVGTSTAYIERFGVDGSDGTLGSLGATSLTPTPASLAVDPSGQFLYAGYSNDTTITSFSISSANGALSSTGTADNIGAATSQALTRKLVSGGTTGGLWE